MEITLNLPDEFAQQVRNLESQLPQILELGLRELDVTTSTRFSGMVDIIEFLATLPTPEQILALRPSAPLQMQIQRLLEKHRDEGLTPEEEQLWRGYEHLEHFVRKAKATALLRLKDKNA